MGLHKSGYAPRGSLPAGDGVWYSPVDARIIRRCQPPPVRAMNRFASFREFYPFYLEEHSNRISRRLHFIGSWGVLMLLATALFTGNPWWALGALFCGYG